MKTIKVRYTLELTLPSETKVTEVASLMKAVKDVLSWSGWSFKLSGVLPKHAERVRC